MAPLDAPGRTARVALDALLVGPEPTGVGRSIIELVRALAGRDRGLDFTLLVTHPEPFAFLRENPAWTVRTCPGAAGGVVRKALFTQRRLPGLCRDLGLDILHSLQFIAPLRKPCRSVVTVHDLAWTSHPGILQTTRRIYYDLLVPRTLARADAIVTNSESTAEEVRGFAPRCAHRVSVTPFGTPSWVWEQARDEAQDAGESGIPYFLFVGTLEPRKNLERLLAAMEGFWADCEAAGRDADTVPRLWLAGAKGWNDNRLQAMIERLQARGRVETLSYCPPERLWALYRGSRGLVFPSLQEGFGFPILEAMAAGCPVLTSGRGAMREVAGPHAVFVDPEDVRDIRRGLGELAWDQDGNRRRIAGGRERARQWDWERTARTTCEVYARVLARNIP